MKQFKYYLMAAFVAAATCTGFSSCSDNDDEESTVNPAVDVVTRTKQHDTAILLCTFGSTYNESLSVYDDVIEDFKAKFPNTDIYMSFTSRTCIGRVEASTGIARYELDQWLKAIGDAGSKRLCRSHSQEFPVSRKTSQRNGRLRIIFCFPCLYHSI